MTVCRRKTKFEFLYRFLGKSALCNIFKSRLSLLRFRKQIMKHRCSPFVQVNVFFRKLKFRVRSRLRVPCLILHLYAGTFCQKQNCIRIRKLFLLHNKFYDITACVTGKTVIKPLVRLNMERRRFFIMKRTAAPVVFSARLKFGVLADKAYNVSCILHSLYRFF